MHTYGEQQHLPNSGGFLVVAPVTLWSLEAICTVSTLQSCATGNKQTIMYSTFSIAEVSNSLNNHGAI